MRLLVPWIVLAVACHSARPAPPPGLRLGEVHRSIRTSSPAAQAAFDRGLVALYGFNYDEARYQFFTAWRADAQCAMCAWGVAMAGATNINDVDKQWAGSRAAAEAAAKLATTEVERALTSALLKRLAPSNHEMGMPPLPPADRDRFSIEYADAMRPIAQRFHDDDDVQIAFAEALLIALPRFVPWWDRGTSTSPYIEEARAAMEHVLARSPNSIGAIHYYIHITDQSPHVAKAAPYADKLGALAPDAGHLVHMPSHTYLSLGRYAEAEDVNIAAIAADKRYLPHMPGSQYEMFTMHPKDYLWYVVFWAGKRAHAIAQAAELAKDPMRAMPNPVGFGPTIYMAMIAARYGLWEEALKLPDSDGALTNIATRFARGLAHVAARNFDAAAAEVTAIRKAVDAANTPPGGAEPPPGPAGAASTPTTPATPTTAGTTSPAANPKPGAGAPTTPPHDGAHGHSPPAGSDQPAPMPGGPPPMPPALLERIRDTINADGESAAAQLEAAIAFARGDHEKAIERCQAAIDAEDELPNEGELTSFPLPARQRLGAYLLAAGRANEAAQAYREDLAKFPENGWSLFGLATALDAQKSPEAAAVWARFQKTWARADVKLTSSVF